MVPKWNDTQSQRDEREEAKYYGPAIGQTGTSTRQELTAWLRVLALPCRSLYATDSASMLNKAKRLIAAAKRNQLEEEAGKEVLRGNPFGKAWGLQVDGDLLEQHGLRLLRGDMVIKTFARSKGTPPRKTWPKESLRERTSKETTKATS